MCLRTSREGTARTNTEWQYLSEAITRPHVYIAITLNYCLHLIGRQSAAAQQGTSEMG